MEYYNLSEDEAVLFKGNVILNDKVGATQLVLTNKNLVFITKTLDPNNEFIAYSDIYSIEEVKIFKNKPQIEFKNMGVEMYLKTTELYFTFDTKKELSLFKSAIIDLLTGKTSAERNAQKVKGAIGLVNETLDVDIVQSAGNLIHDGVMSIFEKTGNSIADGIKKSQLLFNKNSNKKSNKHLENKNEKSNDT